MLCPNSSRRRRATGVEPPARRRLGDRERPGGNPPGYRRDVDRLGAGSHTAAAQRRADYLAAAGEYEQARDLLAGLRDQGKLPKSEWPYVDGMASLAQKPAAAGSSVWAGGNW